MTWGRFSLSLGLRFDVEDSRAKNEHQPAAPFLSQYLGDITLTEAKPPKTLNTFSPRLSLIYDLIGDGKNVFKLNLARYGGQNGYSLGNFINPVGWREIDLRWVDKNGDKRVQSDELFGTNWDTGEPTEDPLNPDGWSYYSGFDPANPLSITPFNKVDRDYSAQILDELSVSFEREILSDFVAELELFYKKYHNVTWDKGILPDGSIETKDNYYVAGHNSLLNKDYPGRRVYPSAYYRTNSKNQYTRYIGGGLVLKKRLSNNWMLDGSFMYMDWKWFYGGDYLNPLNVDYYDGGVEAPQSGGSGFVDVFVNSRWMAKLTGLYQFPLGINGSFTFIAREGYVMPTYIQVSMPRIGRRNLLGKVGGGGKFGDTRLPNFAELNLRVEKVFKIGEATNVVVAADAFNALNSNTALSKLGLITSSNYNKTQRILNPRVFRFGIRFTF